MEKKILDMLPFNVRTVNSSLIGLKKNEICRIVDIKDMDSIENVMFYTEDCTGFYSYRFMIMEDGVVMLPKTPYQVMCISNKDNPSLRTGQVYTVIEEQWIMDELYVHIKDDKDATDIHGTYNAFRFMILNQKEIDKDIEEIDEEHYVNPQEVIYVIKYSLDYYLSRQKDIPLKSQMTTIKGKIVTPIGKLHGTVGIDTDKGLFLIPFDSIIEMEPHIK